MRLGNYMKRITLIIILLVAGMGLQAQKTLEVGVFGGGSYYVGDLNPGMPFLMSKPAYGLVARFNLDPRWTVRLSGYRGKIAGDDNISNAMANRDLRFESNITDISAVVELNFFNYITGSTRNFTCICHPCLICFYLFTDLAKPSFPVLIIDQCLVQVIFPKIRPKLW